MTAIDVPDMTYALLLAVVLIFAVKYLAGIFQAGARGAHDKRYRELAEQAVAAQSEVQTALAAVQQQLARISSAVDAVEKILHQVE